MKPFIINKLPKALTFKQLGKKYGVSAKEMLKIEAWVKRIVNG